ncbi:molybdopterin-guanine dinucleotide biosynthesis protein B [Brevibacillus dissolubilis]|uniref:molybdopterin-guanine dinucleotide biosynthesis protein B n=1 Tax=Brevibacillus dissolubilis TaxID=1844116 RepID=UPI001116EAAC|nr:molybdopterin-guanine dinucleotide biosynthesis protein B [Brevibacillus dissolubilis]
MKFDLYHKPAIHTPVILQFVGYSNSGKTTLIVKLLERLQVRGFKVGVIKHDGHEFEIDHEGKDTYRYRMAGASMVAIQSQSQTAWIERQSVELPQLVRRMEAAGAEIILIEGFKTATYPKIAVLRRLEDTELLRMISNCVAVASWFDYSNQIDVPVYDINDVDAIEEFMFTRGRENGQGQMD